MKIYTVSFKEGYKNYAIREDIVIDKFMDDMEETKEISNEWEKTNIEISDNSEDAEIAYLWSFTKAVFLVSKKAKKVLENNFDLKKVEFLPVFSDCENKEFYIVHCIDAHEVDYKLKRTDGRVDLLYNREKIINSNMVKEGIFKIRNEYFVTEVYVTDKVVEILKANKMDTIGFKLEWDSEKSDIFRL